MKIQLNKYQKLAIYLVIVLAYLMREYLKTK